MEDALSSIMEVRYHAHTGQRHLHASRSFHKGEVIISFGAREILSEPTYLTLQTDIGKHILLSPEIVQFCNHSCTPNVFFDTTMMEFRAIADIATGEEMTFFYPSTEWEMAQPFQCHCGTSKCLGLIRGASAIPEEVLSGYQLTDFIHRQLTLRQVLQPATL